MNKVTTKLTFLEKLFFTLTFYPYLLFRKMSLWVVGSAVFSISSMAHAETIFDKIKNFGQGIKDLKDPIQWIAGIIGLVLIIGGLINWRKTSQNPHQNSNGFSSGVIAILIGVCLLGLTAFLNSVGETVNMKADF